MTNQTDQFTFNVLDLINVRNASGSDDNSLRASYRQITWRFTTWAMISLSLDCIRTKASTALSDTTIFGAYYHCNDVEQNRKISVEVDQLQEVGNDKIIRWKYLEP